MIHTQTYNPIPRMVGAGSAPNSSALENLTDLHS